MKKYRVWDGDTMWYPETRTSNGDQTYHCFINLFGQVIWQFYDSKNQLIGSLESEKHFLMPSTNLVYTADNGKEIYLGDIVSFIYNPELLNIRRVGVVRENEYGHSCLWALGPKEEIMSEYHIENAMLRGNLLGNIHEHKSLAKTYNLN